MRRGGTSSDFDKHQEESESEIIHKWNADLETEEIASKSAAWNAALTPHAGGAPRNPDWADWDYRVIEMRKEQMNIWLQSVDEWIRQLPNKGEAATVWRPLKTKADKFVINASENVSFIEVLTDQIWNGATLTNEDLAAVEGCFAECFVRYGELHECFVKYFDDIDVDDVSNDENEKEKDP